MRREQEVADLASPVALLDQACDGEDVAQRARHLLPLDHHEVRVDPVVGGGFPRGGLADGIACC